MRSRWCDSMQQSLFLYFFFSPPLPFLVTLHPSFVPASIDDATRSKVEDRSIQTATKSYAFKSLNRIVSRERGENSCFEVRISRRLKSDMSWNEIRAIGRVSEMWEWSRFFFIIFVIIINKIILKKDTWFKQIPSKYFYFYVDIYIK